MGMDLKDKNGELDKRYIYLSIGICGEGILSVQMHAELEGY